MTVVSLSLDKAGKSKLEVNPDKMRYLIDSGSVDAFKVTDALPTNVQKRMGLRESVAIIGLELSAIRIENIFVKMAQTLEDINRREAEEKSASIIVVKRK